MARRGQVGRGRGRTNVAGGGSPSIYTLTTSVAGTGTGTISGTGIACPGDCSQVFSDGESVALTASPAGGSVFAGWSGAGTGTGATRTISMTTDRSVTATFTATSAGSVVDGTGEVLKEDLCTIEDPTINALWAQCNSPYTRLGDWDSSDLSISRRSATPDPHIPVGAVSPSTHYRHLYQLGTPLNGAVSGTPSTITVEDASDWPDSARGPSQNEGLCSILGTRAFTYTSRTDTQFQGCGNFTGSPTSYADGDEVRFQNPYDAGVPNTSRRTQIGRFSGTPGSPTFYQCEEGDNLIIYLSVLFQHPTPFPVAGDDTGRCMIYQHKEYPNPGNENPTFTLRETAEQLVVRRGFTGSPPSETLADIDIDKSVGWIRFAVAFRFSNNPSLGRIRVYGDLDGDGNMLPITEQFNVSNLVEDGFSIPNAGPYSAMVSPSIERGYANIQVCEFEW